MIKWLRDILGIASYELVWDFHHHGVPMKGRNDLRYLGGMTKRVATLTARRMNDLYGEGTHWIEPVRRN